MITPMFSGPTWQMGGDLATASKRDYGAFYKKSWRTSGRHLRNVQIPKNISRGIREISLPAKKAEFTKDRIPQWADNIHISKTFNALVKWIS